MSETYRSYSYRHFRNDVEHLYNHLLDLRREEPPDALIERCYYLFLEGIDYPEPEVLLSLQRLALSNWADAEFSLILNRCCYILINYWWLQSDYRQSTLELVQLFKPPYPVIKTTNAARRVRELVRDFSQTEQYAYLEDRARIVSSTSHQKSESEPIRHLIPRYPFLYPYCLLNWDSSEGGQEAVRQVQETREREFEQNLNRYMNHLFRGSRSASADTSSTQPERTIPGVENPTLLSSKQLEAAVKRFVGKAEGGKTYAEQARQFTSYTQETSSYRELKHQIYEYLTDSIHYSDNPGYGKHHFNRWLEERLEDTFPQNDTVRPNSFLLVQTCAQLVEHLVANPKHHPRDHFMFIDMNTNLGATFTIGLLLKILLICRNGRANLEAIKAHLSRRFAIMLRHYETKVRSELEWLIECLENLLVAFSTHFGRADFSWINLV
jgi:hypothetical protein